jgi:branched-subunit amino acid aminotransferase/4-amino-4-deoxychorismate lyase
VFHYALECFEGMKAYRDKDGNARLFRPDMNMKRLTNSARRMFLPAFDQVLCLRPAAAAALRNHAAFTQVELVEMIKQLVKVDQSWIPTQKGYSMYIRPTFIATTPTLGVSKPTSALLYVVMSPVGPYYRSGFNPVRILAEVRHPLWLHPRPFAQRAACMRLPSPWRAGPVRARVAGRHRRLQGGRQLRAHHRAAGGGGPEGIQPSALAFR